MSPGRKRRRSSPSGVSWDCKGDPMGSLERMFVGVVQEGRIRQDQRAARATFAKGHGVAHGTFDVVPDLPDDLRRGVFALETRPVWVRFSSDIDPGAPDFKSMCGIAIKVFGVDGPKLLGMEPTQDFILQNHDVFVVDDARGFCDLTKAAVIDGNIAAFMRDHPRAAKIYQGMQKPEASLLTATYWSILPYALGETQYVKYKLEPEGAPSGQLPADPGPNYLSVGLARDLRAAPARFRFMVQLRTNPRSMPLDRATRRWSEASSPPVHVATLTLPRQDILVPGQAAYGEALAFNPWHSLPEHAPQGSLAEARRGTYQKSAATRHDYSGTTATGPGPRSTEPTTHQNETTVVRAAIHPSIGIGRVGNSAREYLLAPEVVEPPVRPPGAYRDPDGALKRQAARFRVYGLNAFGEAVVELTAKNADIEWTVHVANKKAAWYEFQLALDIPEAADAPPSLLRNPTVADRGTLIIDPGPRSITGCDTHGGAEHVFDTGRFMGRPIYLGELCTDHVGRLVVLGGRGVSASHDGSKAVTFANNDRWHDDVSDGPVWATVRYEGKDLPVEPAWVLIAPPNYAPHQKAVRTMWDLMRDVSIKAGTLKKPARPSFQQDIRPILQRLTRLQWVNAGLAASFGWGGPSDFTGVQWLARLSDPAPDAAPLRRSIARQFRRFDRDSWSPTPWPWQYGDATNIPPAKTPRQHSVLSDTQLDLLGQWADGDFEPDYDPNSSSATALDEIPIAEQPAMLDRAALEFCVADAFHPGCEMTWIMRNPAMYTAPFRLAVADPDWIEPSYGPSLASDDIAFTGGPLGPQPPGGLTRWMAVPWQTDTASCRAGYLKTYDPYLPTFWPARVPNQVLAVEDYDVVMDTRRSLGERLSAFARRVSWYRLLGTGSYLDQVNAMVTEFGAMGVIEPRPGPGDAEFPAEIEAEDVAPESRSAAKERAFETGGHELMDLTKIEKLRRFPHGLRT